jgi:hypothetical protein
MGQLFYNCFVPFGFSVRNFNFCSRTEPTKITKIQNHPSNRFRLVRQCMFYIVNSTPYHLWEERSE